MDEVNLRIRRKMATDDDEIKENIGKRRKNAR